MTKKLAVLSAVVVTLIAGIAISADVTQSASSPARYMPIDESRTQIHEAVYQLCTNDIPNIITEINANQFQTLTLTVPAPASTVTGTFTTAYSAMPVPVGAVYSNKTGTTTNTITISSIGLTNIVLYGDPGVVWVTFKERTN